MIIFGTGYYFRSRKASQNGFCSHCGKYGKLSSWNGMSFFHLYFIPLIPVSKFQRVHKFCKLCNQGLTFPIEHFDAVTYKIKEKSALAILALQEGEEEIIDEGEEPTNAISFLEGALDWLHSGAEKNFSYQLVQQLHHPACKFAEGMVSGYLQMLEGDLNKSAESYQAATRAQPSDYRGYFRLANVLVEKRMWDPAIAAYQSAEANATEEPVELQFAIIYYLIEMLTKQKRFLEASAAYDRLIKIRPDVLSDKQFVKAMTKVKKKAGSPV
jgi:tetratricopeptide (TPR) repeat protein